MLLKIGCKEDEMCIELVFMPEPKQFAKFSVGGSGTCVWLCRDPVQWLYATKYLELLEETSYRFQEDTCLWNDDKDNVYTEIIQNDFEQNKWLTPCFMSLNLSSPLLKLRGLNFNGMAYHHSREYAA
ncbi:hypothetical protein TorRG33x02_247830 [Trema orientale]|uniref:Uncharacterized protein n=1 Tax=Trema orientale TaxID=63057 RepID=A0A2P5DL53_TREOI|nr:hypothetical protein TorRG33x02_247830 [Trema orientale]